MPKRSYEQYCPLALTLDLVGERWTLLIVRDLLGGPKRYTDLHRGLPGLATDLLTERLRRLEDAHVLRRRELAPPAAATVYELTERGRELEPAVLSLARFGYGLLGEAPDSPPPPDLVLLALRGLFDPAGAPAHAETWVLEGGGGQVAVTVSDEGVELNLDPDAARPRPCARFTADVPTLYDLIIGRLEPDVAIAEGRVQITGDEHALRRMRATFPPAPGVDAPISAAAGPAPR